MDGGMTVNTVLAGADILAFVRMTADIGV